MILSVSQTGILLLFIVGLASFLLMLMVLELFWSVKKAGKASAVGIQGCQNIKNQSIVVYDISIYTLYIIYTCKHVARHYSRNIYDVYAMISILDNYFTDNTMSVHFKENAKSISKFGAPGSWQVLQSDTIVDSEQIAYILDTIESEVIASKTSTREIDRKYSQVIQHGSFRIVVVLPPLSDGIEITIVRPVVQLQLSDYNLQSGLEDILINKAKGILIAGSPGSGKSTFAQALAAVYVDQQRIVKTIESPRDLMVPDIVTQYSFSHGSHDDIRDILLLSRPDYTFYDEIRNANDFVLFQDLRLTGIGLIGIIHATRAIDALQRFLHSAELGVLPQVIDTVVYIDKGSIAEVLQLEVVVKVPHGMMSEDLARPVVVVYDFFTKDPLYELYSYGEQTVMMPIKETTQQTKKQNGIQIRALQAMQDFFAQRYDFQHYVTLKGDSITLYVDPFYKGVVIGKQGETIMSLEKEVGCRINVKSLEDLPIADVSITIKDTGKAGFVLQFPSGYANTTQTLLIGNHMLLAIIGSDASYSIQDRYLIKKLQKRGVQVLA